MRTKVRSFAYAVFGRLPLSTKLLVNRRLNKTFQVGLAGVVRNAQGEVLILRHTYRPTTPYGVPSGWLKGGEDIGDALKREIHEETGFTVEFRRVLGVDVCERPARLDIWLEYELVGGMFRPSPEVSEASFVATDSLPPLLPAQRAFLSALGGQEAGPGS